jgi:hypothetical protein
VNEDQGAVEALRKAGGVCFKCQRPSPAMVAVERSGRLRAICMNVPRCHRRIREQLRAEDEVER